MKCNHCQKELEFPKAVLDQLKKCPFCGHDISKAEAPSASNSLKSFFEFVVSEYGEDVFDADSDPSLFDVLKDSPQEYQTETELLRILADFGITDALYNARYSVDDERPTVIKCVKRLCQLLEVPSDTAFEIIKPLAEALGFNTITTIREIQKEEHNEKQYFSVLGLPENASQEQIKAAFRKIALTCHPDKNPDNSKAVKVFRDAQEAYEILSNPQKRNKLSEENEDAEFYKKLQILVGDYPAYDDKFYLLFILHYARRIYDSRNKPVQETGATIRDVVNEIHSVFNVTTSAVWEIVSLIATAFNVKGSLCEYDEDLVDQDGTHYKTIKVGNDVWMAENYAFKSPNSRVYNAEEKNASKYGRLYSLKEAKSLAPKGWHLPSKEEFSNLFKTFKTKGAYAYRSSELQNSCNLTGFNDLAGGALETSHSNPLGGFHDLGITSYYWTSTSMGSMSDCMKIDEKNFSSCQYPSIINFFSVRYIKNQPGYVEEKDPEETESHKPEKNSSSPNSAKPKTEKNTSKASYPPLNATVPESEPSVSRDKNTVKPENDVKDAKVPEKKSCFEIGCGVLFSIGIIVAGIFLRISDWKIVGYALIIFGFLCFLGVFVGDDENDSKKKE